MKHLGRPLTVTAGIAALLMLLPAAASACSVCMGASNTKSAGALNAAIFFMLGFVALMLGSIGAFIFNLKKRSGAPMPPHVELSQMTTTQQDTH